MTSDDEWLADPSDENNESGGEVVTGEEIATKVGTSASFRSKRRKFVELNYQYLSHIFTKYLQNTYIPITYCWYQSPLFLRRRATPYSPTWNKR